MPPNLRALLAEEMKWVKWVEANSYKFVSREGCGTVPVSATVIAGGGVAPGNGQVCQSRRCLAPGVDQRRSGLESRVPASTAWEPWYQALAALHQTHAVKTK